MSERVVNSDALLSNVRVEKHPQTFEDFIYAMRRTFCKYAFSYNTVTLRTALKFDIMNLLDEMRRQLRTVEVHNGDEFPMVLELGNMNIDFDVDGDDKSVILMPKNNETLLLFQEMRMKHIDFMTNETDEKQNT